MRLTCEWGRASLSWPVVVVGGQLWACAPRVPVEEATTITVRSSDACHCEPRPPHTVLPAETHRFHRR